MKKSFNAVWFKPDRDATVKRLEDDSLILLDSEFKPIELPALLIKGSLYYVVPKEFIEEDNNAKGTEHEVHQG